MYDAGDPAAGLHGRTTVPPLFDTRVSPLGAPGAALHAPPPTTNCASFDGALLPMLVIVRTRTKYVPAPTPLAEKVVAVLPVETRARFDAPDDDPASIRYAVTRPAGGVGGGRHESVTLEPEEEAVRSNGGPAVGNGLVASKPVTPRPRPCLDEAITIPGGHEARASDHQRLAAGRHKISRFERREVPGAIVDPDERLILRGRQTVGVEVHGKVERPVLIEVEYSHPHRPGGTCRHARATPEASPGDRRRAVSSTNCRLPLLTRICTNHPSPLAGCCPWVPTRIRSGKPSWLTSMRWTS